DLPAPRKLVLHAGGLVSAGRGARLLEEAAERLVDVGDEARDAQRRLSVRTLDDLQGELVLDRLPVRVELDQTAVRHLVAGPVRPRHRGLQLLLPAGDVSTDGLQAPDERPGG